MVEITLLSDNSFNNWPRDGMVDIADLKSVPFGSAGSSPAEATNFLFKNDV